MMTHTPVESSMMSSVGYDPQTGTLEIEFTSGAVYDYFDVPSEVHDELLVARSHGPYFDDNIREHYSFARVN